MKKLYIILHNYYVMGSDPSIIPLLYFTGISFKFIYFCEKVVPIPEIFMIKSSRTTKAKTCRSVDNQNNMSNNFFFFFPPDDKFNHGNCNPAGECRATAPDSVH